MPSSSAKPADPSANHAEWTAAAHRRNARADPDAGRARRPADRTAADPGNVAVPGGALTSRSRSRRDGPRIRGVPGRSETHEMHVSVVDDAGRLVRLIARLRCPDDQRDGCLLAPPLALGQWLAERPKPPLIPAVPPPTMSARAMTARSSNRPRVTIRRGGRRRRPEFRGSGWSRGSSSRSHPPRQPPARPAPIPSPASPTG